MKSFLPLLLLALTAGSATAQWTTDLSANTQAADASLSIVRSLGASDGSTYVVFWQVVDAPVNIELRAQRLDADGLAMWGANGMLVSSAVSMSTYTVLGTAVLDAEDNLYIGVTATDGELGHVFKLDPAGNHLWGEAGVTFAGGYGIEVLPLSSGEAVVAWLNVPNAWVQKFDATGTPQWPSPQAVVSGSSKTAPGALFELANGDLELIFHTYNFGVSSTLWAQRYAGDTGAEVWAAPVQLSNKTTAWNRKYSVGQQGDAVFIGYSAATGLRFDSFLQRIEADGALPWGINGSDFDVNETDYEMGTRIAVGETGVWSICNYKNATQSENGERVQRFDATSGARLLTDNGKELFPIGSEHVHASDLLLVDNQPVFLLESGMDNGVAPTTLHLVALDGAGDFLWAEVSEPMATFEADKSNTFLTGPVGGQVVAVWMEERSGGAAPFAQSFTFESSAGLEAPADAIQVASYPNPATDVIQWAFDGQMSRPWRVYNAVGAVVAQGTWTPAAGAVRLEVADWPAGTYFMQAVAVSDAPAVRSAFVVTR